MGLSRFAAGAWRDGFVSAVEKEPELEGKKQTFGTATGGHTDDPEEARQREATTAVKALQFAVDFGSKFVAAVAEVFRGAEEGWKSSGIFSSISQRRSWRS